MYECYSKNILKSGSIYDLNVYGLTDSDNIIYILHVKIKTYEMIS